MRKITITLLTGAAVMLFSNGAACATNAPSSYQGFQAGDILVRVRGIGVLPDVTSDVSNIGGHVEASSTLEPEIDATYFFTPNIAMEIIAATTRHHLTDKNSTLGNVDLGKVTLLPPTLTAQYHFLPKDWVNPYLGMGINYTYFFDRAIPAGGTVTNLHYDNNFGAVIQAGADFNVEGNWYLNFDVKHIFLSTTAKINTNIIASVNLDPTIVGFGVGYKF